MSDTLFPGDLRTLASMIEDAQAAAAADGPGARASPGSALSHERAPAAPPSEAMLIAPEIANRATPRACCPAGMRIHS